MCFEVAQFYILHRLYLKEIENYIEWLVFLIAAFTPFIKVYSSFVFTILHWKFFFSSSAVHTIGIWLQEILLQSEYAWPGFSSSSSLAGYHSEEEASV